MNWRRLVSISVWLNPSLCLSIHLGNGTLGGFAVARPQPSLGYSLSLGTVYLWFWFPQNPEIMFWLQLVYFGDDPWNHQKGRGGVSQRREEATVVNWDSIPLEDSGRPCGMASELSHWTVFSSLSLLAEDCSQGFNCPRHGLGWVGFFG